MSEEYMGDEEDYDLDEEMEPEMQGWVQGWKEAGRYEKKEKHVNEIGEDFDDEDY